MNQIFGYKNINNYPSSWISKVKPDLQPSSQYIENDVALFWGGYLPKEKNDVLFENSELLVVVEGNIYFKKAFYTKYPKYRKFQYEGFAAAIIAHLYLSYGLNIISDLTGDFIIIVAKKAEKRLIIVRDKMGGRKLYYTLSNGNIIFSSQIKTLLGVPGISRDIDCFALESFIKFGYVIAPATIFESVKELEPGHLIEISKGEFEVKPYWTLHPSNEIDQSRNQIQELLYENIEENISDRMKPKERIGIYLSGGIDSNTLLAVISKHHDPSKIVWFTGSVNFLMERNQISLKLIKCFFLGTIKN